MRPTYLRHITYAFAFFVTFSTALITYTNSNALARIIPENGVPIVYTIGSLFVVFALIVIPRWLKNIGDVRMTVLFVILELCALAGLAFSTHPYIFVLSFLVQLVIPALLMFNIDIFLEHASIVSTTGRTRGLYLTILNGAFVCAPLITGFVIGSNDIYSRIYLLSGIVLIPAFFIILFSFTHFKDPLYQQIDIRAALRAVIVNKNIRGICISNFLLRSFYSIMVIYLPLYLHIQLLIPWTTIGIMFTVMLLPFVLFEYAFGSLADTRFGEKEILVLGFFVTAISTALLPFIPAASFVLWCGMLFLTRLGASAIETMNDTYFFKQVEETETETIALYRMIEAGAYIIAPLFAALLAHSTDTGFVFLGLGLFMAAGIPVAFHLQDTL